MCSTLDTLFGDPIYVYTRAQAIEDSVLVDLMTDPELAGMIREAGVQYPIAVTRSVYENYIALTPAAVKMGNDVKGRLWDILTMFKYFTRRAKAGETTIVIEFHCVVEVRRPRLCRIKAVVGPGDDGEPVITFMELDED